jgi:hypothetical protein
MYLYILPYISLQMYVLYLSYLRQVGGFLRVLWFPPRYSWNIVESGVKHHNPTLTVLKLL